MEIVGSLLGIIGSSAFGFLSSGCIAYRAIGVWGVRSSREESEAILLHGAQHRCNFHSTKDTRRF